MRGSAGPVVAFVVLLVDMDARAGVGFAAGAGFSLAFGAASLTGGLVSDVILAKGFSGSLATELGLDVPEWTRLGIAIGALASLLSEISLPRESEVVGVDEDSFFPPKFFKPSTLAAPALSSSDILVKWYRAPTAMIAKIKKTLYRRIRNMSKVWCGLVQ